MTAENRGSMLRDPLDHASNKHPKQRELVTRDPSDTAASTYFATLESQFSSPDGNALACSPGTFYLLSRQAQDPGCGCGNGETTFILRHCLHEQPPVHRTRKQRCRHWPALRGGVQPPVSMRQGERHGHLRNGSVISRRISMNVSLTSVEATLRRVTNSILVLRR